MDEDAQHKIDVFRNKNLFGHASDSSIQQLYNVESEQDVKPVKKYFAIEEKPFEAENEAKDTSAEPMDVSFDASPVKTLVKLVEGSHHSKESDENKIMEEMEHRKQVFRNRNSHGHSSDSTLQDLLYNYGTSEESVSKKALKNVTINEMPKVIETSENLVNSEENSENDLEFESPESHIKLIDGRHHAV